MNPECVRVRFVEYNAARTGPNWQPGEPSGAEQHR